MLPWCWCLSLLAEWVSLSLFSQFTATPQALRKRASPVYTGAPREAGSHTVSVALSPQPHTPERGGEGKKKKGKRKSS